MDKGQLITEKLINDNGCTRDDVAYVTAKNVPELTVDTVVNASSTISTQVCKLPHRGKEPNDKKVELKNIQEVCTQKTFGLNLHKVLVVIICCFFFISPIQKNC